MGASEKIYRLPLPSGAELAAMDVDLRVGRASVVENTSATTSAGNVVGDCIVELLDIELYGLELVAVNDSTVFSWASIVAVLKGPMTPKMCYRNFK